MPEQSKFENMDLFASLEAIMKQNTCIGTFRICFFPFRSSRRLCIEIVISCCHNRCS